MKRKEAESLSPYLSGTTYHPYIHQYSPERFFLKDPSGLESQNGTPNPDGSFNFDLSEGSGLLNEYSTQKLPSYLSAFMGSTGFPFPMMSPTTPPVAMQVRELPEVNPPVTSPKVKELPVASPIALPPRRNSQPLLEGSSSVSSGIPPEDSAVPKPKSKRGRKKKKITPEAQEEEMQRRMERNRVFARENRKRKKQYIASLEAEIAALKAELQMCRNKLAQYEVYERERCRNFMDFYMKVKAEINQLQENLLSQMLELTQSHGRNLANIAPYLRANLEDRYKAIDVMAETMIQFSVPVSHRYLMYVAENGPEAKNLQLFPALASSHEDFNKLLEQVKVDGNELMKVEGNRKFLKSTALKIRKNVHKFFSYEKKIQEQISAIDRFMVERLLPRVAPHTVINFLKWVHTVAFIEMVKQIDKW